MPGSAGSDALVGQAAAPITVNRPAPGQTVQIQSAAGDVYDLNFPPGQAQVQVQGDDFVLAFDDDGDGTPDSRIVFLDLVTLSQGANPPVIQLAGVPIGSGDLIQQALALAGEDDSLEAAAGPGALGGFSSYNDNLGDLIDLLVAQGVIPPVELEFGLIDVEADPIFPVVAAEIPLLINELDTGSVDAVEIYNPGSDAVDLTGWNLQPDDAFDFFSHSMPSDSDAVNGPAGGLPTSV